MYAGRCSSCRAAASFRSAAVLPARAASRSDDAHLLPRYRPAQDEAEARSAVERAERESAASGDDGPAAAGGDPVQLRGIPAIPVRRLGERPSSSPPPPWRAARTCPRCGKPRRNARNRCRCPKPKGISRPSPIAPREAQPLEAPPPEPEPVEELQAEQSTNGSRRLSFEERRGIKAAINEARRAEIERLKQEAGRCRGCGARVEDTPERPSNLECCICYERARARRRQAALAAGRGG